MTRRRGGGQTERLGLFGVRPRERSGGCNQGKDKDGSSTENGLFRLLHAFFAVMTKVVEETKTTQKARHQKQKADEVL